jgi:hypothetical protein
MRIDTCQRRHCRLVSFLLLKSSCSVNWSSALGMVTQSEPREKSTFDTISFVPLAAHSIPATFVSGERLNKRTLALMDDSTYDAAMVSTLSGRLGGHSTLGACALPTLITCAHAHVHGDDQWICVRPAIRVAKGKQRG